MAAQGAQLHFPQTLPSSETSPDTDNRPLQDEDATVGQHKASKTFTPPLTFDDPDLISFYLTDGLYLDLHTDRVYFALIRCTDPETGWSFPSIPDLEYLTRMKHTAVRKYLKVLCEEPEKGGLGKFSKVARQNGSAPNGYFLNAWANELVPEPYERSPNQEAKRE